MRRNTRAAFILFTDKGERVPFFTDRFRAHTDEESDIPCEIGRHGWREVREWVPGSFAQRSSGHYRVGLILETAQKPIKGSIYQLRAWDLLPPREEYLDIKFPNIASVEMYLRHRHGHT